MSRLVTLLVAGVGATSVAVGGTYIFGGIGKGNGDGNAQLQGENTEGSVGARRADTTESVNPQGSAGTGTSQETQSLKFGTLEEFKTNRGYKCSEANSIFSDEFSLTNLEGSITEFSSTTPAGEDFFGSATTDASKIKSCLIINWEKKTYVGKDKWSGTFTWTWSFVNDTKGFIVTNIAKAEETGKLKLTGGSYLLEKESGQDTWKVKYKKEVTNAVEVTDSNFDRRFPKVKENSGVSIDGGTNVNYWGFMKDKNDLAKICNTSSCTGAETETPERKLEEFKWTFSKNDDGKKVSEWSDNLDWWDEMYKKSDFDLETKLESFKGIWNKVRSSS